MVNKNLNDVNLDNFMTNGCSIKNNIENLVEHNKHYDSFNEEITENRDDNSLILLRGGDGGGGHCISNRKSNQIIASGGGGYIGGKPQM